ncbi:MAG: hypothetical protein QM730_14215 [Anaerolineales bacterium]
MTNLFMRRVQVLILNSYADQFLNQLSSSAKNMKPIHSDRFGDVLKKYHLFWHKHPDTMSQLVDTVDSAILHSVIQLYDLYDNKYSSLGFTNFGLESKRCVESSTFDISCLELFFLVPSAFRTSKLIQDYLVQLFLKFNFEIDRLKAEWQNDIYRSLLSYSVQNETVGTYPSVLKNLLAFLSIPKLQVFVTAMPNVLGTQEASQLMLGVAEQCQRFDLINWLFETNRLSISEWETVFRNVILKSKWEDSPVDKADFVKFVEIGKRLEPTVFTDACWDSVANSIQTLASLLDFVDFERVILSDLFKLHGEKLIIVFQSLCQEPALKEDIKLEEI